MKCDSCKQEMRKIGPFARVKREGEPSAKFDGFYNYECINDECSERGKVVKVKSTMDV